MHRSGPRSRRRAAAVVVLVTLLALLVVDPALVAPHSAEDHSVKGPDDVKLVAVSSESDAKLWPFTSRQKAFESLTLPINAVVREDADRMAAQLRYQRDTDWQRSNDEWTGIDSEGESIVIQGTDIQWGETTGATRYTYVSAPGAKGGWMAETAQLHDGTYFGSRYHLRLYEGGRGDGTWTAVQAHHEHWDWFRLRHTVGSLAKAQQHLEGEYFGKPYVADVSRERFANGGISDADGWVSVVDLRPLSTTSALVGGLLLFGSVSVRNTSQDVINRLTTWLSTDLGQRSALLFGVLLSLPLFVRSVSILVETSLPGVPVKLVAGTLYAVLVLGVPVAALWLPHAGEPFDWAALAVLGLGIGFVLDYQSIGIDVLPIAVVLHRLTLLAVVGWLAAAASRPPTDETWNRPVAVGLALWIAVLAWPLFLGL